MNEYEKPEVKVIELDNVIINNIPGGSMGDTSNNFSDDEPWT